MKPWTSLGVSTSRDSCKLRPNRVKIKDSDPSGMKVSPLYLISNLGGLKLQGKVREARASGRGERCIL